MKTARLAAVTVATLAVVACKPIGARAPGAHGSAAAASKLAVKLDGKGVETAQDGSTRIAGHGATPFTVLVTAAIDRHPVPGEEVTAILTTGERVVRQAPFVFGARDARAKLEVPGPGNYRVELWSNDRFLVGNTFVAASLPTLDGQRALELHQDAAPRLFLNREKVGMRELFGGSVRLMHWDTIEADTGYIAEWWHEGKRVGAAGAGRSRLQTETLLQVQITNHVEELGYQTPWRWTTQQFDLPDHLPTRPGLWELRVYRENKVPFTCSFVVNRDGTVRGAQHRTIHDGSVELDVTAAPESKDMLKKIAKLPGARFEASKRFVLPVTVAEVRALTRSSELRGLRIRMNALNEQANRDGEEAAAEAARAMVPMMQKMIAQLGEPWLPEERP